MNQAEALFKQALDKARSEPNQSGRAALSKQEKEALCLYQLGKIARDKGDGKRSLGLLSQALALQEKVLFAEHPDRLRTLTALLSLQGEASPAALAGWQAKKQAIEARLHCRSETAGGQSDADGNSAPAKAAKKPAGASPVEMVMEGREKLAAYQRSATERAAVALAEAQEASDRKDYKRAKKYWAKALDLQEQHYGKDSPEVLACLVPMARGAVESDCAHARVLLQRARMLCLKHGVPLETVEQVWLALASKVVRRHDKLAETLYQDSLAIVKSVPRPVVYASWLHGLSQIYHADGNFERAKTFGEASMKGATRKEFTNVPINDIFRLADTYIELNDYASAIKLLRAYNKAREDTGQTDELLAESYRYLATIYGQTRLLDEAVTCSAKAISLKPAKPNLSVAYLTHAQLLRLVKRNAESESAYRQSLALGEKTLSNGYLYQLYLGLSQIITVNGGDPAESDEFARLAARYQSAHH